jgi:hypothetical protein
MLGQLIHPGARVDRTGSPRLCGGGRHTACVPDVVPLDRNRSRHVDVRGRAQDRRPARQTRRHNHRHRGHPTRRSPHSRTSLGHRRRRDRGGVRPVPARYAGEELAAAALTAITPARRWPASRCARPASGSWTFRPGSQAAGPARNSSDGAAHDLRMDKTITVRTRNPTTHPTCKPTY